MCLQHPRQTKIRNLPAYSTFEVHSGRFKAKVFVCYIISPLLLLKKTKKKTTFPPVVISQTPSLSIVSSSHLAEKTVKTLLRMLMLQISVSFFLFLIFQVGGGSWTLWLNCKKKVRDGGRRSDRLESDTHQQEVKNSNLKQRCGKNHPVER